MTVEVLLVDDEVDAIELFRQSFRREIRRGELVFRFTTSGDEALTLLTESDAADRYLLLSDINMPGMSGLELLREVKRRWPSLVVIMVSAYGDADNRRRALECGADDFVTKPVDFGHLRRRLGAYVAGDGIRRPRSSRSRASNETPEDPLFLPGSSRTRPPAPICV